MMKLALIGRHIQHSLSPKLYAELIGPKVEYELIDVETAADLPSIDQLASRYDGVNITSPYKTAYLSQVKVADEVVELGAINTISFGAGAVATNTDFLAVLAILARFQDRQVVLLGSGSMARITLEACLRLGLSVRQFSRRQGDQLENLDLSGYPGEHLLVINSCSREFSFLGQLPPGAHFWDYNYQFHSHQHLRKLPIVYEDGQELLRLQAEQAVRFWRRANPKLNS
jgi:shikimate 5-dehydrogenase